MAKDLTERQNQALRGRVHGGVLRKPIYVKGFEADPHGMWRIGQTSVREGITHQQVAEFVVNARDRNMKKRKSEKTKNDYGQKYNEDRKALALGEAGKGSFDAAKEFIRGSGKQQRSRSKP